MIIELLSAEPDGYGGHACALIDSRFVIGIEPVSFFEGRVQRHGSRVYLSSGAQINSTLPARHVADKVWPGRLPENS